jgi:hypothetical protein
VVVVLWVSPRPPRPPPPPPPPQPNSAARRSGCFGFRTLLELPAHSALLLLLQLQLCRARSCATHAGPFCSTREGRPASAARCARPLPPCRHQVRTGPLRFFSSELSDVAIIPHSCAGQRETAGVQENIKLCSYVIGQ